MKLWKRLAAGLLAGVMAVGSTISAGAADDMHPDEFSSFTLYKSIVWVDNRTFYYQDTHSFLAYPPDDKRNFETVETLTDLGTIENYGDPEKETSVLIPASQLANYPVNTVAIVHAKGTEAGFAFLYMTDGKREGLLQDHDYYIITNANGNGYFVITKEMKKNGLLLTGYAVEGEKEAFDISTLTVESIEFTNGVATEYEKKNLSIDTLKFQNVSLDEFDWNAFDENSDDVFFAMNADFARKNSRATVITPDELSDFSVGDFLELYTTNCKDIPDDYHLYPTYSISIPYFNDDEEAFTTYKKTILTPSIYGTTIRITEAMKMFGFGITVPDDVYLDEFVHYVPMENSEIDPIDPVVTPGFLTPAGETSVKEVPLGTVVTQKTAVSDGRYGERFVKKVAASDVVGKTKATFTLSNGSVTKTVSTTKYNTALTVDGETLSAGSGYVFLTYTLSGIPEDVTVTVSDVVLE